MVFWFFFLFFKVPFLLTVCLSLCLCLSVSVSLSLPLSLCLSLSNPCKIRCSSSLSLSLYCFILEWCVGTFKGYTRMVFAVCRQRPYHVESTGSRPITEVKQRRARLVPGWVTAWEHRVLLATFFLFSFLLIFFSFSFLLFSLFSFFLSLFSSKPLGISYLFLYVPSVLLSEAGHF